MEDHISQLFDLVASKAYGSLTNEEKAFVDQHISPEEYEMQRSIIASTEELEYPSAVPLALEPLQASQPILMRSIPLYQMLIGAACLLVGFFLFSGKKTLDVNFSDDPFRISIQNNSPVIQVVHDTVFKSLPLLKSTSAALTNLSSQLVDTVYLLQEQYAGNTRMLDASVPSLNVRLNESLVQSSGVSAKDDKSTTLLPKSQEFTMK